MDKEVKEIVERAGAEIDDLVELLASNMSAELTTPARLKKVIGDAERERR
ncbi:MAG: hypothetical protein HYX92_07025 [Chloroflexi bacterium]|nr:hypothetical protein [Chloroflexota bacterium]